MFSTLCRYILAACSSVLRCLTLSVGQPPPSVFEETMGFSSTRNVGESIKLCIFDLKRGQMEGQELDKILFFFPLDSPFSTQLSLIGLSEGLITFTRIFSPDDACEAIEAERHSHIFHEPEPDIWMVMVVDNSKRQHEGDWHTHTLRKLLKEAHSFFTMFHGSIRRLLEQDPTASLARIHLHTLIGDYLIDFTVGKMFRLPSYRDSLTEGGMLHVLTVSYEVALEVQSLVSTLEWCAGNTQCHSLLLFHDLLCSTTLSHADAVNVFNYAVMRMSPRALSPNGKSLGWPGESASNVSRMLQCGRWSKAEDGFLGTDTWAGPPVVWLQQAKERACFCAYQHGDLTVIILIPLAVISDVSCTLSSLKQRINENALVKILKVEDRLSKGWGGENAYHVGGYRYLVIDHNLSLSRASPASKLATLSKESMLALARVRDEIEREKRRGLGAAEEKSMQVSMRTRNNVWVIAHIIRGKELYLVLERARETLLYASTALHQFSDRYCGGAFSL